VVTRPSIADPRECCHVRTEPSASIPLRSVAVRCSTRYMILRTAAVRLALAALWLTCTAALFLVLDLYT